MTKEEFQTAFIKSSQCEKLLSFQGRVSEKAAIKGSVVAHPVTSNLSPEDEQKIIESDKIKTDWWEPIEIFFDFIKAIKPLSFEEYITKHYGAYMTTNEDVDNWKLEYKGYLNSFK
jgi:hypothetical protein